MQESHNYPLEFRVWWKTQPTFKAFQIETISPELYQALTQVAYSGWLAHGQEIIRSSEKINSITFNQVRTIISEKLGVREDKIEISSKFVDDLSADSLDQVELIMAFEDFYKIEIDDTDAEEIKTVKDAVQLLHRITGN